MLLDKHGHLKLADFGTCMRMDKVNVNLAMWGKDPFLFPHEGFVLFGEVGMCDQLGIPHVKGLMGTWVIGTGGSPYPVASISTRLTADEKR